MRMEQITIFDLLKKVPFQKGDIVTVKINTTPEEDPEVYYYALNFKNKRGVVSEVIVKPVLQYRIRFGEEETYFYHDELIKIHGGGQIN